MTKLAQIEALLFVAGEEGLRARQIGDLLDMPATGVQQSIEKLKEKYEADPDAALTILESSSSYKLVTKADLAGLLREFSKSPMNQSLSRASLETLSIVAYKQPITRVEIDDIRGVNSSGALAKLAAFELIKEAGKKEVIGRPNLYVTTDYFLDYMGINSLEDLPTVEEVDFNAEESVLFQEKELEEESQENEN